MAEPLPTCYLNGSLMPLREARISPLDRSFLFGDGVYEVIRRARRPRRGGCRQPGAAVAQPARAAHPQSAQRRSQWTQHRRSELIGANGGGDLYVYLQVSRGAEYGRNHAPLPDIEPTVFGFCAPLPLPSAELLERGVSLHHRQRHALGAL